MNYLLIEEEKSYWFSRIVDHRYKCILQATISRSYRKLLHSIRKMSIEYKIEGVAFVVDNDDKCRQLQLIGIDSMISKVLGCRILFINLSKSKEIFQLYQLQKYHFDRLLFLNIDSEISVSEYYSKIPLQDNFIALKSIFEQVYHREFSLEWFLENIRERSELRTIFEYFAIELIHEMSLIQKEKDYVKIILSGKIMEDQQCKQYIIESLPVVLRGNVLVSETGKSNFLQYVIEQLQRQQPSVVVP